MNFKIGDLASYVGENAIDPEEIYVVHDIRTNEVIFRSETGREIRISPNSSKAAFRQGLNKILEPNGLQRAQLMAKKRGKNGKKEENSQF